MSGGRNLADAGEVAAEGRVGFLLGRLVGEAEQVGRVHGNIAEAVVEAGLAAVVGDRQRLPGEREDGGGAECHDEAGADEIQLLL